MARKLGFNIDGATIELELIKVERSKLYGSSATEALDEDGNRCQMMTLASDGKTLFGEGGSAMVLVTPDGAVVNRDELTPVDVTGTTLAKIESSFNQPINDLSKATPEEYLSGVVKSVYGFPPSPERDTLKKLLADGSIYKFDFSYRGGIQPDNCFLLLNTTDDPFMVVTNPADIKFLGFEDSIGLADDSGEEVNLDELDFDMM